MKRALCFLAFSVLVSWGQVPAQAVNQVTGPSPDATVKLPYYDGNGNLIELCIAPAYAPAAGNAWSTALSNLTNIVVAANVGTINFTSTSYYWVGMQITVANSATTALNGTYKVTAVSGSTATIATSGVGNATYTDMTITTTQPVLNQKTWAIQINNFNGTNQLISTYWANSRVTGGPNTTLLCSDRANY